MKLGPDLKNVELLES